MITLVTGATGLLGNNVVRALLDQGKAVRAMVRQPCDSRPLDGLDVEIVSGDIRDPVAVRKAAQNVDQVIHSAARVQIGWSGMAEHEAVNVEGTRTIAEAAREADARLIYVSSVDALGVGTPESPADEETLEALPVQCPYVVTKREAEKVVLELVEEGLDAVIVNPGFMIGPWDWKPSSGRMILAVAKHWAFFVPRGVHSYCDVRDVAQAILAAAQRGRSGQRYILAGTSLSYLAAWRVFASVAGGRRPVCNPPGPLAMLIAGTYGDLRTRLFGREPEVNSASIALAQLSRYYTSARAERELGYRQRSLRESVEAAWNWFLEYGYARA